MADEGEFIKITLSIVDKDFALTIKEEEEELVRSAAALVKERVANLAKQYHSGNQKDYLSMALLLLAVDYLKISQENGQLDDTENLIVEMDEKLATFFEGK